MLWFHHLLSGEHRFLSLSVELPHIFQGKEGGHWSSRWDVSGRRREGKQRPQSCITGRNLSWHRSASTLPQRIKRNQIRTRFEPPPPKITLISCAEAAKNFFFLQPLAFILIGINVIFFPFPSPSLPLLIRRVHSGVEAGKWPSITTLLRENRAQTAFSTIKKCLQTGNYRLF